MPYIRIKKPSKPFLQMNNVFSFNRFGNFFMYELRHIASRFTHDMLTMGILPLMMATFSVILNLIQGEPLTHSAFDSTRTMFSVVLILTPVIYPARMFGRITDKKAGADWMLIPASGLEKFISVLLINLIVVPGILVLMLFVCDKLLWLIFGEMTYGAGFFTTMTDIVGPELFLLALSGFVNSSLTFLLGAVCFRKAKVAKTILVLFALSVLFSVAFAGILSFDGVDLWIEGWIMDIESLPFESINVWLNISIFGSMILLAGAIYYRLKTIKY